MAGASSKRVWKLQDFVAHGSTVNCLSLGNNSGRVLATGGEDRKVNVWVIGKPNILASLSGHTSPVTSLEFDQSEGHVISGSRSGTIKLFDLDQGKVVRTLPGHHGAVTSLDFHPFGDFVASGSADHNVKVWDIRRKGCIYSYKGHTGEINSLRNSPDGRWIMSGSQDGTAKLWDLTAGKALHTFQNNGAAVQTLQFHPNEFLLATGGADRIVHFWDLEKFSLVSTTEDATSAVRCLLFHPEEQCLYVGYKDLLRVHGWEPSICHDSQAVQWGNVKDMVISSNQLIAASCYSTNVSVWVVDLSRLTVGEVRSGATSPTGQPLSASGRKMYEVTLDVPSTPESVTHSSEQEQQKRQFPTDEDNDNSSEVKEEPVSGDIFTTGKVLPRTPPRYSITPFLAPSAEEQNSRQSHHGAAYKHSASESQSALKAAKEDDMMMESLTKGHRAVCDVLDRRHACLERVHRLWAHGDLKGSVQMAADHKENDVLIDLLSVMCLKRSLWSLDISLLVLNSIDVMLKSKCETHYQCASSTVQLILKNFAQVITSNLKSSHEVNIDLNREDRYRKCKKIWDILQRLKKISEERISEGGRVATLMKELQIAFTLAEI